MRNSSGTQTFYTFSFLGTVKKNHPVRFQTFFPILRFLFVAGMGVARFKVFFSSNDGAMTAKTSYRQVLTLDWQLLTTAGTGYFLSCGYGVTIMCRMPWLCISAVPLSVLRRQFQVVWVVARLFALPITPA